MTQTHLRNATKERLSLLSSDAQEKPVSAWRSTWRSQPTEDIVMSCDIVKANLKNYEKSEQLFLASSMLETVY